MNYRVGQQLPFARNLRPSEFLAVAVITNRSRGEMDLSAFLALSSHKLSVAKEPVELLDGEGLLGTH